MKGSRNWALGIFGLGLIAFSLHPATPSSASAAVTSTPVVVAARAIAQGSVITGNDLRVGLEQQPPVGVFARPSAVVGRTAAVNIGPGRVVDDAAPAATPIGANETIGIHVDGHLGTSFAPGDVVEVVGIDPSSNTAVAIADEVTVEEVASASTGVDVTAACKPSCAMAVVGAELQARPLALVRVSAG